MSNFQKSILLACFFAQIFQPAAAQNRQLLDSLSHELARAASDSARAQLYFSLSEEFYNPNLDSAVLLLSKSCQFAQKSGCSQCQIDCLRGKSFVENRKYQLDRAIAILDTAAWLAEKTKNWYRLARVEAQKGGAFNRKKDYEQAIFWAKKSAQTYETYACTQNSYSIYFNFYAALSNSGRAAESIEVLKKAIAAAERWGSVSQQLNCLVSMTERLQAVMRHRESLFFAQKSLELAQRVGDKYNEAMAWYYFGQEASERAARPEQLNFYEKAAAALGNSRDAFAQQLINSALGMALAFNGQPERAKKPLQTAFDLSEKSGDNFVKMNCLRGFGKVAELENRPTDAENFYKKAVELSLSGSTNFRFRYFAASSLLDFYENQKQWEQALAAQKQVKMWSDSMLDRRNIEQTAALETAFQFEKEKAMQERKLLLAEQARLQLETAAIATNLRLSQRERELLLEKNRVAQQEIQVKILENERQIRACELENREQELQFANFENEKSANQLALLHRERELQTVQNQRLSLGIGALALLLLTLGAAFFAFQNRQKLLASRADLERERERTRLREQISRDLHDEIGSTIGSIALFGKSLQTMLGNSRPDATSGLNRIVENAHASLDGLRDVVWTIDTRHDRAEDLVARIRDFVAPAADAAAVELLWKTDLGEPDLKLHPTVKKNVWLIAKEAIANALRYSGTRRLSVEIGIGRAQVFLKIEDFGAGFEEKSLPDGGNGLKNMRVRAAELGGKLDIETQIGSGTRVVLTAPQVSG